MANLFANLLGRVSGKARARALQPDAAFAAFLQDLAAAAPAPAQALGTISFGHVTAPDEPLPFYAAVAMLSARRHHPLSRLLLFCEHEPHGACWEMVRGAVRWCPVPAFGDLDHALARQWQGRMLLVRLMVLGIVGGAFAATDMLMLRGMDDLAHHPMVFGVQATAPVSRFAFGAGLALARPGNDFCRIWLEACLADTVLPLDDLACRLPVRLYAQAPRNAHILPHTAWFSPIRQQAGAVLFGDDADQALALCADSLALPLWSDLLKEALDEWAPRAVAEKDCLFSRLCRPLLPVEAGHGHDGEGSVPSGTV